MKDVVKNRILITGGAGFIGSNLVSIFYLKDMKWYAWIILPRDISTI
jgi:dTDP-D-glucose 4,6-dehydratase